MNNIPTETENKKMEELFLAIYFNDLDRVIEFKNQYPEIYAKKGSFLIDGNTTFDLTNLTYFNLIIWTEADWREEILPFVRRNNQRTKLMSDFWRAESGQQNINRQIEYNHYREYFFCEDPNDSEEIILDPVSVYLEKGFRETDLRLYNRAQCFDFLETKKLLEQGAKPDIHFHRDGDSSTFSRILTEISFLATCQIIPEFQSFESEGYNQDFYIARMFGALLGLAAHEEMYSLLTEYEKGT